jgi:hypothetical protein
MASEAVITQKLPKLMTRGKLLAQSQKLALQAAKEAHTHHSLTQDLMIYPDGSTDWSVRQGFNPTWEEVDGKRVIVGVTVGFNGTQCDCRHGGKPSEELVSEFQTCIESALECAYPDDFGYFNDEAQFDSNSVCTGPPQTGPRKDTTMAARAIAPTTKQRTATAIHEAGHALAYWLFHVPFTGVSIIPAVGSHYGQIEKEPKLLRADHMHQREVDERIMIALAGTAAEARHTGRTDWAAGSADFVFAFNLAAKLPYLSVDDVDHYLRYLWARTQSLFNRSGHWEAVQQIADRLLAEERIDYTAVASIAGSTVQYDLQSNSWRLTRSPAATTVGGFLAFEIRRGLRVRKSARPFLAPASHSPRRCVG